MPERRPELSHDILPNAGAFIVTLRGPLDANAARGLKERLDELLGDSAERVVFDCRELTYVGANGLGLLLAAARELQRRGGRLALCNLPPDLADVFRLPDLDELVPVFDSLDGATAMVSHGTRAPVSRRKENS